MFTESPLRDLSCIRVFWNHSKKRSVRSCVNGASGNCRQQSCKPPRAITRGFDLFDMSAATIGALHAVTPRAWERYLRTEDGAKATTEAAAAGSRPGCRNGAMVKSLCHTTSGRVL
jgi:hypothetical protein